MRDPLVEARLEKLESLRDRGVDPYPPRAGDRAPIGEVISRFCTLEGEDRSGVEVRVAGRLLAVRRMGGAAYLDLRDGSGQIQLRASRDGLGEPSYEALSLADIGDFLWARGEVFRTKKGELTVETATWGYLAKAIRPLPEKWHGLKDIEIRYRHRSLDLIANTRAREAFVARSRMIAAMRRYLDERGFLEVETPILQPIVGGATARPFVTRHHTLDMELYLRVAPELYLKRLVVGGLERVYELGRNFRNEGVSTEHYPEFTTLEVYEAYSDYEGMMALAEDLLSAAVLAARGALRVSYQGKDVDFTPPWRRMRIEEAVEDATGVVVRGRTAEEICSAAARKGLEIPASPRGKAIEHLFEAKVEPSLVQPTFILDYPVDISPLAKCVPGREDTVERFELFVAGMEVGNAFTELNDPLDQRRRFEAQEQLRVGGDEEAQRVDEDFLFALEHGMPPTGGIGFGIDRLAMVLTDSRSIRDVILFPALRPRREA